MLGIPLTLASLVLLVACSADGPPAREAEPAADVESATSGMRPSLRAALIRSVQADSPAVYEFVPDARGLLVSAIPTQGIRITIGEGGAGIASPPDAVEWRVGFRLAALGRGEAREPVGSIERPVTHARNRASLIHDGGVEEWYENGTLGLEQGFVVPTRPTGSGSEPLSLEIAIDADVEPVATEDGTQAWLRLPGGGTTLRYTDLFARDARGDLLDARMEADGHAIVLRVSDHGARYPIEIDPLIWVEVTKVTASDAADFDEFGWSVAISGDTAVVGAWHANGAASHDGAAYVFDRDLGGADAWGERVKLTASDGGAFGRSVAISNDSIIVGAEGAEGAAMYSGAAYVFDRNFGGADNWGERRKLIASDGADSDVFGTSVAISGDTAIVGATSADGPGIGAAYVFDRDFGGSDAWGERQKLTASDAAGDLFGTSVGISGDTAIVGAYAEDGAGTDCGAAYVFDRDFGGADAWGERRKLTASDAESFDLFGNSVAISGDIAIVGAIYEDAVLENQGAAYIFDRNFGGADAWGERRKLTASDGESADFFGASVGISGDTAIVGAPIEGGTRGAAYLFERDLGGADAWEESRKMVASDAAAGDDFGRSVAASGEAAIVGASRERDAGWDHGAAYVFGLLLSDGDVCADGSECASRFCVDGVCCDTDCAGGLLDCQACSVAEGAAADGTCGSRADGLLCEDDGLFCNGPDTCVAGACAGSGDPCAASVGDADDDCAESCDEAADACTGVDPEGTACSDGLFCTGSESCSAGVCGGSTGDSCAGRPGDGDEDCSEACDETADDCVLDDPDDSVCNDGLDCNGADFCTAGACDRHDLDCPPGPDAGPDAGDDAGPDAAVSPSPRGDGCGCRSASARRAGPSPTALVLAALVAVCSRKRGGVDDRPA